MTKKILPLSILAILTLVSCGKQRQCKGVTTDVTDDGLLKVLVVDHQIKCEDITEMGFEIKTVNDDGQTLERTEMHTVSCRDYDE